LQYRPLSSDPSADRDNGDDEHCDPRDLGSFGYKL
jgi:hypothetical protein